MHDIPTYKRAARGQRPPLVGEEVRKEYIGKVGIS